MYNIEVNAESKWVRPIYLAVGFFIRKIFCPAVSRWVSQNSFQQNEDLGSSWECCYLAFSAPKSTPWNQVIDFPSTILLSVLRSDEQGRGSCRQTELVVILSHNSALHSNIPQVHALGQNRSGKREINNGDKNSPWLDKTSINWVKGQELPIANLGI